VVDAGTVFQLASVSKPLASTVVAALVGDGVVAWDDPLVAHVPEFVLADLWTTSQVTLRDLFAHRSGLADHAGDLLEDIGYGRAEVLRRLRYRQPASGLRAGYFYTNFGLTAAADGAARAAGRAWEDVAADRLYRPLGMTSTSSRHADYLAAPNRARLHVRAEGRWVARHDRDADAQSPAGGVSSTVRDLAQWLRLQLGAGVVDGRRIVDGAALAETHRPTSGTSYDAETGEAGFYGLGWNVSYDGAGRLRLGHSGAFGLGAATVVNLVPAERLGIAVLTNAAPRGVPEAIGLSLLDLALTGRLDRDYLTLFAPFFDALGAPTYGTAVDYTAPPAQATPPLAAETYIGTYGNDYFGPAAVVAGAGGLVLHLGPGPMAFPLRHWDRDVFLYQPTGENAFGLSGVTFAVGPDRRATSVSIENLALEGAGTFARTPSGPAR
jgi:CubicO group peptidase (beta-lactamase class C family)